MTAAFLFAELQNARAAPVPGRSLRACLRDATADQHAKLDATMGGLDLRERSGYVRFLEMNAAALLPLEAALAKSGAESILPDWKQRQRTASLKSDLERLGGRLRPVDTPARFDHEAMLGVLYVLEGSRLGAKFILRDVMSASDSAVPSATAYLRHGEGVPFWQIFLRTLEAQGAQVHDDTRIIAGARLAFDLFARATQPL